jgi:hypothetical protein
MAGMLRPHFFNFSTWLDAGRPRSFERSQDLIGLLLLASIRRKCRTNISAEKVSPKYSLGREYFRPSPRIESIELGWNVQFCRNLFLKNRVRLGDFKP